jgi:hypothetical protein
MCGVDVPTRPLWILLAFSGMGTSGALSCLDEKTAVYLAVCVILLHRWAAAVASTTTWCVAAVRHNSQVGRRPLILRSSYLARRPP